MSGNGSLSLFGALRTLYGLKNLKRQGWLQRGIPEELCESVADHIHRTARAGSLYTADSHLVAMLRVHDWGESIIGDITPLDDIPLEEKHRREKEAMLRITRALPYGRKVMKLWEEYEAGRTNAARTAVQLDKLDASVTALMYEQMGYDTNDFHPYTRERLIDPTLIGIFNKLLRREHDLQKSHQVYFDLLREVRG